MVEPKNSSPLSINLGFKTISKIQFLFLQDCIDCFDCHVVMVALYVIGQTIIFLPCDFYLLLLSSSFFLSSPNLSGRRLDIYRISAHGVALVRIQNACLKPAARGSLKIQDAKMTQKIAIWASSHKFVELYLRN